MQTLRRKAIVTSPGPARVSAYRLAEFAIQHNVMSAADMTVVARLAAQDAGQWLDMCSRNQETLPSAASTTTRKRKLAQHSGSLIGFIDPSVEIQGRACLAGLQAIATPNASVADEGSITELISVWLRIGSMESIDEHAFGFAVKIQVQLIKTLSSILAAGEPRLLSRFFPLVAKLIAHSLHHPESEVREASAAAMNAFRRLLHPIVPPMVSSAVRAVVSSSSVGLNGLVTGDATSVFATQDGRNVHSLSASGWVPDTQPHLALSSSGPGKDPVSWTRTPTDAKATRENSHAANAKTDVSAGVKPAPQPLSTSVDVSPRTVSTLGLAANAPTAAEHAAAIHASKDDHVVGAMDHTAIPSTHAIGDLRASELEDGSSQADVDMDGADSDSAESFPSIQMDDEDDDDEE
ncbi:hypothetical protein BC831DRAFT_236516 [Entophlyctis helioformis]|nr:hypothetical protein BC831DRAFT_236516 [Entophlyctis helioformis]